MSSVDESGLVVDLIKNCERWVAEKVAGLTKEEKASLDKSRDLEKRLIAVESDRVGLVNKNRDLEKRLSAVESDRDRLSNQVASLTKHVTEAAAAQDIPLARCMQTMQNAFWAAYSTTVSDDVGAGPLTSTPKRGLGMMESLQTIPETDTLTQPQTKEPCNIPEQETNLQPQRKRPCLALRRNAPKKTATTSLITNFDDLDPTFKEQIQPFYTKSNKATMSDHLNECQRAFVKYQADKIVKTSDKITTILVAQIIREGVTQRLWPNDFCLESGKDFTIYLTNRFKNEKKRLNLKALKENSNERLQTYVDTSLSNSEINSSQLEG